MVLSPHDFITVTIVRMQCILVAIIALLVI